MSYRSMFGLLWLSFLFILSNLSNVALADAPVTMRQSPEFKDQRQCVFFCFGGLSGTDRIANEISCDGALIKNDCFCRADLQSIAVEHVSSCVNQQCKGAEIDIGKATDIYKNYCTSNGYTQLPASRSASPTSGAFNGTATATATVTSIVTATVTATITLAASASDLTSSSSASLVRPVDSFLLKSILAITGLSVPSTFATSQSADGSVISTTTSRYQFSGPTDSVFGKDDWSAGSESDSSTTNATSDNKNDGSGKLKTGEIVGIVVGVLGLLFAAGALIINWKSLKENIKNRKAARFSKQSEGYHSGGNYR